MSPLMGLQLESVLETFRNWSTERSSRVKPVSREGDAAAPGAYPEPPEWLKDEMNRACEGRDASQKTFDIYLSDEAQKWFEERDAALRAQKSELEGVASVHPGATSDQESNTSAGPMFAFPPAPTAGEDLTLSGRKKKTKGKAAKRPTEVTPLHMIIMQILISVVALVAGVYFAKTGSEDMSKAAVGWIGLVIGYWLR